MSDTGQIDTVWPLPAFHFTVDFGGGLVASFAEVSGLDQESEVIEYRAGNSAAFSPIKMPGIAKAGHATLKRGIFGDAALFRDWQYQTVQNTVQRRTATISLLAESGKPVMVWTLTNAWPTKISSTDMKATTGEVSVDTLELAFETMSVVAG